ncbi:MAG: SDR family NAD(P)-dependent oxidoreductase, partial [Isosphaeraceae bacterium]|nr:SDR family NAD(P)-dependent oxidoreductase [Isosphaeraceae bacterium]
MSSLDAFRLRGRVAFVSGGGGAIGSAIASALGSAGANVVIGDISEERGAVAAENVRALGVQSFAMA